MMKGRHRRRESGSVTVELTLSMAFLVPLFIGAALFGYTFLTYSKLENAVRAGPDTDPRSSTTLQHLPPPPHSGPQCKR